MLTFAEKIVTKTGRFAPRILMACAIIFIPWLRFEPEPQFDVQSPLMRIRFVDPGSHLGNRRDLLIANLKAAVEAWNQIIPFSAPLDFEVKIDSQALRFSAASHTSHWIQKHGDRDVFEEGAAYKLRTGKSADPGAVDINISVNPDYLDNEIWLSTEPKNLNLQISPHRIDLISVMKHELAHAIGFHSFRDIHSGLLPQTYMSLLDRWTAVNDGKYFFIGPEAQKVYGGPVPITSTIESQNFSHYGNPGDPKSLLNGLMNGVVFHYQHRYDIGPLDLAILRDLGLLPPDKKLITQSAHLRWRATPRSAI